MADEYAYFELDGAVFRCDKRRSFHWVTHVMNFRTRTWELYTGKDKRKPVAFGTQLTADEMRRLTDSSARLLNERFPKP